MPVAYGIWVYSAVVAGCFAMGACRSVSSARDDAAGRESLVVWTNETVNVPAEERRLSRYSEGS